CSCTYVLHLYFSSHVFSPYFHHLSRPPPLSTLFPYTTLFRSSRVRQWRRCGRRRSGRRAEPAGGRCAGCGGGDRRSPAPPRTGRDRKSTRLNSSHVSISYAVFCLKKKIRFTYCLKQVNKLRIT